MRGLLRILPIPLVALVLLSACGGGKPAPMAEAEPAAAPEKAIQLDKDKPVMVRPFAPPSSGADATLPTRFHDQLVFALYEAGFTAEEAAPAPAPGAPAVVPAAKTDTQDVTASDTAAPTDATVPPSAPSAAPSLAAIDASGYLLSGHIAVWHISGPGLRDGASAEIACVYQLRDNTSGELLASGTASGRASRSSRGADAEALAADLTHKALTAAARDLVSRLNDADRRAPKPVNRAEPEDRRDYQDSPGKRLREKR